MYVCIHSVLCSVLDNRRCKVVIHNIHHYHLPYAIRLYDLSLLAFATGENYSEPKGKNQVVGRLRS